MRSGVISRVTIVISPTRGLITLLINAREPPRRRSGWERIGLLPFLGRVGLRFRSLGFRDWGKTHIPKLRKKGIEAEGIKCNRETLYLEVHG